MNPKVGLLPLCCELDHPTAPDRRPGLLAFCDRIAKALERAGLDVVPAPICRVAAELKEGVRTLEDSGAVALVTLQLAGCPSHEFARLLAGTALPIIVLDTTPALRFGPGQDPRKILFNQGIRGVQEMCNLFVRSGKPFSIEAGHWRSSDVMRRVAAAARGAAMASALRRARVGLLGRPMDGGGKDVADSFDALQTTLGLAVVPGDAAALRRILSAIGDEEVDAELALDRRRFRVSAAMAAGHRDSVCAGLAVRRWIEEKKLSAFTFHFANAAVCAGLPAVPFLEASKALGRGIGYAGGGDVLTAALTGAVASVCPAATFIEMFCPDWQRGQVFLGSQGEVHAAMLSGGRPALREGPLPGPDGRRPMAVAGCLRAGRGALVNLAPLGGGRFRLILTSGAVTYGGSRDGMGDLAHGWFRPDLELPRFLETYSRLAGTHRAVLVHGDMIASLRSFGECMNWETAAPGGWDLAED